MIKDKDPILFFIHAYPIMQMLFVEETIHGLLRILDNFVEDG